MSVDSELYSSTECDCQPLLVPNSHLESQCPKMSNDGKNCFQHELFLFFRLRLTSNLKYWFVRHLRGVIVTSKNKHGSVKYLVRNAHAYRLAIGNTGVTSL